MKKKKGVIFIGFLLLGLILSGCGNNNGTSGILKNGAVYKGLETTDEVIEVESSDRWIVRDMRLGAEDMKTNYKVVSVSDTGEEIEGYPIITLTTSEVIGSEDGVFSKEEGEKYIVTKDSEAVYFRSITEENKNRITKEISDSGNPDEYIKEKNTYIFKQP